LTGYPDAEGIVLEQYDWQRVYSAWDAIYDRL